MQETTAENLDAQTTALLCVDLQKCYYQPPVTHLFPDLESMFGKVLSFCRTNKVQVVHVRQEDVPGVSKWLPWWQELHPDDKDLHFNIGVPHPLDCAKEQEHEQVFIKNTFDGFLGTGLHEFLQSHNVKTLIVMGLITRACVLNTVMSGFNHGYRILLLEDCCGDRCLDVHQNVMKTYDGYNCKVINYAFLKNMNIS